MQNAVIKINKQLAIKNPAFEVRYYNNKYTNGKDLFQLKEKLPNGEIKYVTYQTENEQEFVDKIKDLLK